jgi:hypothetical protein
MEEQIIFFTSTAQSLRLLRQIVHTFACQLILVLPETMGRLQVSLFLRLIRRQTTGQPLILTIVSSNPQARILAEQIGFASAATLDEARGLMPDHAPTARRHSPQPPTPAAFPTLQPQQPNGPTSALSQPASPTTTASAPPPTLPTPADSTTDLSHLLREGYLPNPAAIPSLEEEAQRAAREEEERRSRLSYEIADEHTPTPAQEEAEEHEAQIISTILKTSRSLTPSKTPNIPQSTAPQQQTEGTAHAAETQQTGGTPHHLHNPDDDQLSGEKDQNH